MQELPHRFGAGERGRLREEATHFAGVRGEDGRLGDAPAVFGGQVEAIGIQHHGAVKLIEQAVQCLGLFLCRAADTGADDQRLRTGCRHLVV